MSHNRAKIIPQYTAGYVADNLEPIISVPCTDEISAAIIPNTDRRSSVSRLDVRLKKEKKAL